MSESGKTHLQGAGESNRFAHEAMNTTFEILIAGQELEYARQAAAAAFAEIDRIEAKLSRFVENSDVARINACFARSHRHGAERPIRIDIETFECLLLAQRMAAETNGAFDVTVGALMACWRSPAGAPLSPTPAELSYARERTGAHLLELDEATLTVRLGIEGVVIDLGAIGKGFALDQAAEVLREWDVKAALLHSGTSTALALGAPPGKEGWPVGIGAGATGTGGAREIVIRDKALSASGFEVKGRHIIDPRTGQPAKGALRAWALAPSAAVSDALSTAFMVMTPDEIETYCRARPNTAAMLLFTNDQEPKIERFGSS